MGIAALVLVSLLAVTMVRVTGIGASKQLDAAAIAVRDLRFEDRPDGGIDVFDARDDRLVDTVQPATNGFIRGTLRGLSRERKRVGVGPDSPYRLIARADGRLTLEDPSTGRRVDLESFGPTNTGAFAKFLVAGSESR
jgi:putative photosynthetic complex assembly protein